LRTSIFDAGRRIQICGATLGTFAGGGGGLAATGNTKSKSQEKAEYVYGNTLLLAWGE
jgi:hypothetical protein